MGKTIRSSHDFFHTIQKRNEEAKLHKSPEKKKMDELESVLLSSRKNWRESKKKLIEAQKLIKQLKSQIKDLKDTNADLERDIKYMHKNIEGMKNDLVIARAKVK